MPGYDSSLFSPPAPLARVTLRNPDTGATMPDAAMLLDSGADVTLVPRACLELLGLKVDPNEAYELIGFDGRPSVARVVRLDLVLLRRTFKGRYLPIDQEWGLVGRDVLNHLSLLLDGPRLTWSEPTTP
jgi:hypothetical protein